MYRSNPITETIRCEKTPLHVPMCWFSGYSYDIRELAADPFLQAAYHVVPPRMQVYQQYSEMVTEIYLKLVKSKDLLTYAMDLCFIDATEYLEKHGLSPRQFATLILREVHYLTGLTPIAGIGTNLYLCKDAMDIIAKDLTADENGFRIAELSEDSFREKLWEHEPLNDFWQIGPVACAKLQ